MPKKIIPITQARKDLFKIAENAQKPGIQYVLTINGRPELILMSFQGYSALMQAIKVLKSPKTPASIKKKFSNLAQQDMILREEPTEPYKVRER